MALKLRRVLVFDPIVYLGKTMPLADVEGLARFCECRWVEESPELTTMGVAIFDWGRWILGSENDKNGQGGLAVPSSVWWFMIAMQGC